MLEKIQKSTRTSFLLWLCLTWFNILDDTPRAREWYAVYMHFFFFFLLRLFLGVPCCTVYLICILYQHSIVYVSVSNLFWVPRFRPTSSYGSPGGWKYNTSTRSSDGLGKSVPSRYSYDFNRCSLSTHTKGSFLVLLLLLPLFLDLIFSLLMSQFRKVRHKTFASSPTYRILRWHFHGTWLPTTSYHWSNVLKRYFFGSNYLFREYRFSPRRK